MAVVSSPKSWVALFFARAGAHPRTVVRRKIGVYALLLLAFAFVSPLSAGPLTAEEATLRLNDAQAARRMEGITVLKTLRRKETALLLQNALATEQDPQVQLALLDAMGSMPELVTARSLNAMTRHSLVPVRKRAVYVLGLIGGRDAERMLAQVLGREADANVKALALQGLSLCGSSLTVPEIEKALKDKRPKVRAKAVESLRHIPGKEAEKALESAANDQDKSVREIAQRSVERRKAKNRK